MREDPDCTIYDLIEYVEKKTALCRAQYKSVEAARTR